MTNKELMYENANFIGRENNMTQIIEECAELVKAISKYKRTRGEGVITPMKETEAYDNLLLEIADVSICIKQFIILNNCDDAVNEKIRLRLEEINKRYKEKQ